MGVVYRAHDEMLERPVAVKLLNEGAVGSEGRARLLKEARAAASLNHPNIVTVFDAGEIDERPYIVMELIEGYSLHESHPDSIDEVISIARQLTAALSHAHANAIIHRDLKPENVVITPEGSAKLMDFGLARSVASRLTIEGAIVGTVFYLAPEQALGKKIDGRADLYALGVLLYELVTGRLPFTADEAVAVISQHLHAAPVTPRTFRDDLDPAFERLILRLLEKDPEDRYPTAEALGEALSLLDLRTESGTASELTAESIFRLDQLAHGRLVGRRTELSELQELWAEAQQGRGQLALISGEPGVGKTRLANELIVTAQLHGAMVMRGGSYEFEATTPYMPFVEAIREWVRDEAVDELKATLDSTAPAIAKLAPELEAKIGPLPELPPLSPNEERLRLFDSVARLLRALSGKCSVIVFMDDLHWADQGSLNLLHYLLRHLHEERVLFLGCYREVELDRSHPLADSLVAWNRAHLAKRIALDRFSIEETRDLLDMLFQESGSEQFVAAVYHETEGNPFFVEEVVKALVESGEVYRKDRHWERVDLEQLAIPQSVKEAIGRRLSRLSEACTQVLYAAAVLGKTFPFEELARLIEDEEPALDALDEARRAHLVRSVGGENFAFTHDKIREVLYQELNPIRRRRLHKRVGELLENLYADDLGAHMQDLAHHFTECGDLDKGYRYSMEAASQAIELYALDQAVRVGGDAVDCALGQGDQEKARAAYALQAQAYFTRGRFPQAIEALEEAIERTDDTQEKVRLMVQQGSAYTALSDPRGREVLEEAIEALEGSAASADLAHAITMLGRYHHYSAEHEQAIEHYQKALGILEPLDDPMALIHAYSYLAGAYQHLTEFETSNEYARRAMEVGKANELPFGEAAGYEFMAENAANLGRFEEAMEYAKADLRIGEEHGFLDRIAWSKMVLTWAAIGQGHLKEAIEVGLDGLALAEELGELRLGVWFGGYIAQAMTESDPDPTRALEHAQLAIERAEALRQVILHVFSYNALAIVYVQQSRYDEALALVETAHELAKETENIVSQMWNAELLIELYLHYDRLAEAQDAHAAYRAVTDRLGSRWLDGKADTLLARISAGLGDGEAAQAAFERAIEHFENCGARPEQARALMARGEWWQGLGDHERAREDFKASEAIFEACGMVHALARVRSSMGEGTAG